MAEDHYDIAARVARGAVPLAKYEPLKAAIFTAIMALVVTTVFKMVAVLPLDAFLIPTAITVVAGFVIAYACFWFERKNYMIAFDRELDRLRVMDDAKKQ